MRQDPTCGTAIRGVLRARLPRGSCAASMSAASASSHGREVISVVALFCILMMVAMMWMMMGGMSAFHGGPTDRATRSATYGSTPASHGREGGREPRPHRAR